MTNSKNLKLVKVTVIDKENMNSKKYSKQPSQFNCSNDNRCHRPITYQDSKYKTDKDSKTRSHINSSRSSPIRIPSPKGKDNQSYSQSPSPTLGFFYAGAKFSEPPAPHALPKPPKSWTAADLLAYSSRCQPFMETSALRTLLKVQA